MRLCWMLIRLVEHMMEVHVRRMFSIMFTLWSKRINRFHVSMRQSYETACQRSSVMSLLIGAG